jgi:hypothetical protein
MMVVREAPLADPNDIFQKAFLDELVKIGAEEEQRISNKDRVIQALKTIGIAGAGSAAGMGAAYLTEQAFPQFMHAAKPVKPGYVRAVQIGLPILGAVGLSLGTKYRRMVDEGLMGTSSKDERRT